jgi:polysaccharide biosynthesis/export protein
MNHQRLPILIAKFSSITASALVLALSATGCRTTPQPAFTDLAAQPKPAQTEALVLHEGDSVRVSFPGAANLNTTQQIRRDGRIALPLVGEFKAAGLTTSDMEKELVKLYGPQLQTKEVMVAVESSAFPIYVIGAVLRPGKIMADRPMTALEAILEAGGFDPVKANQKAVTITRNENGRMEHYTLDLKKVLEGRPNKPFNLKPADVVYVPERFTWF